MSSPRSYAYSFCNFFLFLSSFAFLNRSPLVRFPTLTAESLGRDAG